MIDNNINLTSALQALEETETLNFEGETRLIFRKGIVNPRGEIGKIGIRIHDGIGRIFHSCITVRLANRTLHLNRKSAVKWIRAQEEGSSLSLNAPNKEILEKIGKLFEKRFSDSPKEDYDSPLYQKSRVRMATTSPLCPSIDKIKGSFWNLVWRFFLSSWNSFRLRFLVMSKESTLHKASEARAKSIFWTTVNSVSAYRELVGTPPARFDQIPITDKASYIVPNQDSEKTYVGGKIPHHGQSYTSTGTTGNPTTWMIGPEEQRTMKTLMHYGIQSHIGDQPIFFLNAFAMGPWATGITTSFALMEKAMTFSLGPDTDKVLDTLEKYPPSKFPDRKYVVAGYPDFMDRLVTAAKERNLDLKPFHIFSVVGGDAISDTTRARIQQESGIKVISAYGASDLDFPIGQESDFTDELRKACIEHPEFAKELFGNQPLPMMFQYDPLNYYIESNADRQMIYTCVRHDRASPRIRYNLKDTGQVMRMSDLNAIAKKHGVSLPVSRTCLPLLYIWGREGAVTYQATKVFAENLAMAIQKIPALADKIENYGFRRLDKSFNILLELKKDAQIPENTQALLIEEMKKLNQDFRAAIEMFKGADLPQLEVFEFSKGPMAGQPSHAKKRYIFT